jgi:tripartite-type tricarboxylate transporter receptor subunit TctC
METDPYVIAVAASSPYKTFADLLAAARAGPVAVGGFGAQSGASFFANQIESATHVKLTWVPFSGGSAALAATLGGHIAATIVGLSGVTEQFEAGQVRILAIATNDPLPQLKGVPTFASLGYKDLTTALWRGVMTRAGVPAPVETQLVDGLRQIYNDPEFQAYIKTSGLLAVFTAHDDFTKLVQRDMATIAAQTAKPG